MRDFAGGPLAKTHDSQGGNQGSTPGQGVRSHVPQLRPGAAKETMNKCVFRKVLKRCPR